MEEIPVFATWFPFEVRGELQQGIAVPEDVQDSCTIPSAKVKTFKSMYAYGYHFRVKSAERSAKSTFDSGVATIFCQPCRSRRQERNLIDTDLEYIG